MLKFDFEVRIFVLHIRQIFCYRLYRYVCIGVIQTLWFLNLLVSHISKCIKVVPAEPSTIYDGIAVLCAV